MVRVRGDGLCATASSPAPQAVSLLDVSSPWDVLTQPSIINPFMLKALRLPVALQVRSRLLMPSIICSRLTSLLITFPVTLCLPNTWTDLHSKNRLCVFLPRDLCKYCDFYLERPCLSLYSHVLSVSDQMSIPVAFPLGKASLILLRTDRCPQVYPHHSTYTT